MRRTQGTHVIVRSTEARSASRKLAVGLKFRMDRYPEFGMLWLHLEHLNILKVGFCVYHHDVSHAIVKVLWSSRAGGRKNLTANGIVIARASHVNLASSY